MAVTTSNITCELSVCCGCCTVCVVIQTSVDGVYAIGDVASFPLLCAGGVSVRQEHVTHARSSAAQAAHAIMGEGRRNGQ